MKAVIAMILVVFVAGCGANGEPDRPTKKSGVTISGTARIGATWRS